MRSSDGEEGNDTDDAHGERWGVAILEDSGIAVIWVGVAWSGVASHCE